MLVAGYLGYMFGVQPYLDATAQVDRDQAKANKDVAAAHQLLDNRAGVKKEWGVLQTSGLKTNASDAESVTLHAITNFAENLGIHVDSHKTEAPKPDRGFPADAHHSLGHG